MNFKRMLSKAAFYCSGWLSHVKTYQRYYSMDGEWVDKERPPPMKLGGWHWFPCQWSMDMLKWSMRLDRVHWDHWACQHIDCNPRPCTVCGGVSCDEEDDDD